MRIVNLMHSWKLGNWCNNLFENNFFCLFLGGGFRFCYIFWKLTFNNDHSPFLIFFFYFRIFNCIFSPLKMSPYLCYFHILTASLVSFVRLILCKMFLTSGRSLDELSTIVYTKFDHIFVLVCSKSSFLGVH